MWKLFKNIKSTQFTAHMWHNIHSVTWLLSWFYQIGGRYSHFLFYKEQNLSEVVANLGPYAKFTPPQTWSYPRPQCIILIFFTNLNLGLKTNETTREVDFLTRVRMAWRLHWLPCQNTSYRPFHWCSSGESAPSFYAWKNKGKKEKEYEVQCIDTQHS